MELVQHDDQVLRLTSQEFDFQNPQADPWELSAQLEKLMQEKNGLGLSAIQVGLPLRVFCMKTNPDVTMFNPRVVDVSEQTISMEEGCLSFPGLLLKVTRPRLVKARFFLKDGSVQTMKFDGITARVFLHEMEHLEGKLFFGRASRLKIEMAVKKAERAGLKYDVRALTRMRF